MASSPTQSTTDPAAVAAAVSDARLLRVFVRPTGAAVAAAGLLARATRARGAGFQLRPTRAETVPDADGTAVAVGWSPPDVPALSRASADEPLTVAAAAAVREAGGNPHPVLALAGAVAAGESVTADRSGTTDGVGTLLEAARRRDAVTRRPGVATPTADIADGVAHSTRLRLPVSGDPEAATTFLSEVGDAASQSPADLDPEVGRAVASVVAVDATSDAPPTAVDAVESVLRPAVTDGPFQTVGGFADVLAATARVDPGLAGALAVSPGSVRTAALDRWRAHGQTVHGLLDGARTARYDGVSVVRVDPSDAADDCSAAAALPAVCRLAAQFQSPEATTLAVTDGGAAVVTRADHSARGLLATAVDASDTETTDAGDTDTTDAGDTAGVDETAPAAVIGNTERADVRTQLDTAAAIEAVREVV
jgi:hypothetical protein